MQNASRTLRLLSRDPASAWSLAFAVGLSLPAAAQIADGVDGAYVLAARRHASPSTMIQRGPSRATVAAGKYVSRRRTIVSALNSALSTAWSLAREHAPAPKAKRALFRPSRLKCPLDSAGARPARAMRPASTCCLALAIGVAGKPLTQWSDNMDSPVRHKRLKSIGSAITTCVGLRPEAWEIARAQLTFPLAEIRGRKITVGAVIAVLAACLLSWDLAHAQLAVTDPALELTQIQTNAQSLLNDAKEIATQANQYLTELNSYVQQIQQYENMIQNTITLPAQVMGQVQGVINHAMQVVDNVGSAYARAEGIAMTMANIDKQFQLRFPGYAPAGSSATTPTPSMYASRINGTLNSIQGSMAAVSQVTQDLANEKAAVAQLQNMSQNSIGGTVQAVQAAHAIALHQVDQLDKLQSLIAAQAQAQTNYYANQVQNQSDLKAQMDRLVSKPVTDAWQ
jgi:type IV secretion system protein TrbJ